MRVLHFIPSLKAVAGSALLSYKLDLLRLMSTRAEVAVLTSCAGGVSLGNVKVETCSAIGTMRRRSGRMMRFLSEVCPDIVHVHACSGMQAMLLVRECRRRRIPVLVTADRRLEPWHSISGRVFGRHYAAGITGRYILKHALALHAICGQESGSMLALRRYPWPLGGVPLNGRVVEIDAYNIVGGMTVDDMLDAIMALYRKMYYTYPFPRMAADERRAEDELIAVGVSGDGGSTPADRRAAMRSYGVEAWRRIYLHAKDEGVADVLLDGMRLLGVGHPDSIEADAGALDRFVQNTCGKAGSGHRARRTRAMRKLDSGHALSGHELEVSRAVVDAVVKARRSCIHRSDFAGLYRTLRFTDYDEDRVETFVSSVGLLKDAARLMKILEERYGLTEGYMFTVPLDDRSTNTLRNKLFKSGIQ